jgi:hypothetical protein
MQIDLQISFYIYTNKVVLITTHHTWCRVLWPAQHLGLTSIQTYLQINLQYIVLYALYYMHCILGACIILYACFCNI